LLIYKDFINYTEQGNRLQDWTHPAGRRLRRRRTAV